MSRHLHSTWRDIRFRRQEAEVVKDARSAAILSDRRRVPLPERCFLWPAVGTRTPPVRVLNPDGTLREVVPAEAFRRRRNGR